MKGAGLGAITVGVGAVGFSATRLGKVLPEMMNGEGLVYGEMMKGVYSDETTDGFWVVSWLTS
jgi:hypothetical protein